MNSTIPGKIKQQLSNLSRQSTASAGLIFRQGQSLYLNGQCNPLSMAEQYFEFSVDDKYRDYLVKIKTGGELNTSCTCSTASICRHGVASLMQLHELLKIESEEISAPGIRYTRKGMIKRVIEERKEKARIANYRLEIADNIFGEHVLTNERGISYKLTFRDIERRHGYCSCPDYRTNKLGTCKHLIFAFEKLEDHPGMIPENMPEYPFIEVFLNPFRDNKISWFYPGKLTGEIAELFYRYFGNNRFVEDEEAENLVGFFRNTDKYKQILVRPEVLQKVEEIAEKATLERLKKDTRPDFSLIKAQLFPYQEQGVEFATFKTGAVIADEMGLGKTIQAIATAVMKKDIFGFERTLIVCPATIKYQWKQEIEQFTNESAVVVEGSPEEREQLYRNEKAYFLVVNYETLIRDHSVIVNHPPDFIILDEAQRIKNYASVTSSALKAIPRKHALVITGTPIESRLIDLYSIILFVEPGLLSPLWEFSYQHCYFDQNQKNRIVGYYDLQELNQKLENVMLRREKHQVVGQLPRISEINIPVKLHPYQQSKHVEYAREAISIYRKKVLTTFDIQRTVVLVKKMRMVADSTFLIDDTTNFSPKLDELRHILSDKLNIAGSRRKVVIFTEWKKMVNIIARVLRLNKIGFVEITGDTPVKQRNRLIKVFENEDNCKIFLSTETGGSGLNLQVADTVINFEVPYTSLQKNQRLGRIDRIGQQAGNLTIINLIAEDSLEEKITRGLELENALTDSLLNPDSEDKVMELTDLNKKSFLTALQKSLDAMAASKSPEEIIEKNAGGQMLIDFTGEGQEIVELRAAADEKKHSKPAETDELSMEGQRIDNDEVDRVMSSGIDFLSNLFRITTGKNINLKKDNLEYNPDTGEITIKFRIAES